MSLLPPQSEGPWGREQSSLSNPRLLCKHGLGSSMEISQGWRLAQTSSLKPGGSWCNTLACSDPRISSLVTEVFSSCVSLCCLLSSPWSNISPWSSQFLTLARLPFRMSDRGTVHPLQGNLTPTHGGEVYPHGHNKMMPLSSDIGTFPKVWVCQH